MTDDDLTLESANESYPRTMGSIVFELALVRMGPMQNMVTCRSLLPGGDDVIATGCVHTVEEISGAAMEKLALMGGAFFAAAKFRVAPIAFPADRDAWLVIPPPEEPPRLRIWLGLSDYRGRMPERAIAYAINCWATAPGFDSVRSIENMRIYSPSSGAEVIQRALPFVQAWARRVYSWTQYQDEQESP